MRIDNIYIIKHDLPFLEIPYVLTRSLIGIYTSIFLFIDIVYTNINTNILVLTFQHVKFQQIHH